jgi:RNA polymerase sigma-B factor
VAKTPRDELIEKHLPLARSVASRYTRRPDYFEDLFQVAALGLVKAADRFDPSLGFAFSSLAVPTMVGEIKRHFRDATWAVHVPRGLRERAQRIDSEARRLQGSSGCAPSAAELAEALGMEVEDVLEARAALTALDALSLDEPSRAAGDSPDEGMTAGCRLGSVDPGYDLVEDRVTIGPALAGLPQREQRALSLRFAGDLSQREIAGRIGISQMHVSRIIRRSIATLQAAVGA